MKTIAILWNSMGNNFLEALKDIEQISIVHDCFKINFNDNFSSFISDIYPYKGDQKWKLDYKIGIMNNRYTKNEVMILFLEIPDSKRVYIERKKTYIYENVEKIKKFIRCKYKEKVLNYSFDNIFHMTDDESEYLKTLQIIKKYLIISFINNQQGFIELNKYLYSSKNYIEKNELNGKRDKFWFAGDMFMYKKAKDKTYELYSELFADEMAGIFGLECTKNIPTIYNDCTGMTTLNFINNDELFIDGSHIIDFCITGNIEQNLSLSMDKICKFNNLEMLSYLIEDYCLRNNLICNNEIFEHLQKMFVFDTILLQTDRNPNNWGILINKKERTVRVAPLYDNTNMMGMNKDIKYLLSLSLEDVYHLPTVLVPSSNDSFFEHRLDLIRRIDNDSIISIFEDYLNMMKNLNIDKVFSDIEKKSNIIIPYDFKHTVRTFLIGNINNLDCIIKTKQKIK